MIDSLGVEEKWLRDPTAWHDAAFHDRFQRKIKELFPEEKELAFKAARSLYTEKKLQRFTSLAGLLLTPKVLFSKLPTASGRMNLYNTYEFKMVSERVAYSSGLLTQHYLDASLPELNASLCDAARGSLTGIMSYFGNRLLNLRELRCVKLGHSHCEYELTWVNRPFLKQAGLWILITLGAYFVQREIQMPVPLYGVLSSILLTTAFMAIVTVFRHKKSLREAFEYQDSAFLDLRTAANQIETLNRGLIKYQKELSDVISLASIGEMSFSVVHDMAGPMTLLRHYTEVLSAAAQTENPNSKDFPRYCAAIEKATEKLVKLQEIFRMAARNQVASAVTPVDLKKVITDCQDLYRLYCDCHQVKMALQAPDGPVMLESFEGCMETIVVNLIQNALNALGTSLKKEIMIEIREDASQVTFLLRDTGPGIPPERLKNLWERFGASRGDSRDARVKGSGFGLYSIMKVVHRVGGAIDVQSDSNGTRFSIVFPKELPKALGTATSAAELRAA